ncbi:hypothetical protein M1D34_26790 (plasmid) [Ensifer sp. D2-11]
MQWIEDHRELITALTGLGTLAVWVIYLQVFVSNYRRQLRATLLITRGAGSGLDARCFLSNMSSGPVHVASVLVKLETPAGSLICPVTDMLHPEGEAPAEPRQRTRQGPLGSGEIRDLGSFGTLMRHALHAKSERPVANEWHTEVRSIMVEIVGHYGSEDLPIGARRVFVVLENAGGPVIRGRELQTEQIRNRRDRRRLVADLERDR